MIRLHWHGDADNSYEGGKKIYTTISTSGSLQGSDYASR